VLVSGPGQWRAVVTDFGLALRSEASDETASLPSGQGLLGTPAYMSPEQIEGRPATTVSDIYALGLVIYEMVTGQRPFQGDTPMSAAMKRLSEPPTPPRHLVSELSPTWEEVILRCLKREPTKRFAAAWDVVAALSRGGAVQNDPPEIEHPIRFIDAAAPQDSVGRQTEMVAMERRADSRSLRKYARVARIALTSALFVAIAGIAYQFRGRMGTGHPASVHAAVRPTIAVLGFKNLSGKPEVAWISPALSQMLSTELTAGEKLLTIPSEDVTHGSKVTSH
jgi:serine/threonine protein kinase